jgi:hypothetical protein
MKKLIKSLLCSIGTYYLHLSGVDCQNLVIPCENFYHCQSSTMIDNAKQTPEGYLCRSCSKLEWATQHNQIPKVATSYRCYLFLCAESFTYWRIIHLPAGDSLIPLDHLPTVNPDSVSVDSIMIGYSQIQFWIRYWDSRHFHGISCNSAHDILVSIFAIFWSLYR